ncbi:hypothetical protein CPB84DRAFT_1349866 [Gymnopilus junonius]|uniref:Secreted protein n=1 Tax=Gymnopilus junonius TaxID=109634 RepID=A0A9P5NVF7_GYMJU|nr:hypothetical protein CPB84DRAFT_1349866 [Gymnopilus junonius]
MICLARFGLGCLSWLSVEAGDPSVVGRGCCRGRIWFIFGGWGTSGSILTTSFVLGMQCNNRNNALNIAPYIPSWYWFLSTFWQEATRQRLQGIQLPRILCIGQKRVISRFTRSRTSHITTSITQWLACLTFFYFKTDAFLFLQTSHVLLATFSLI